MNYEMLQQKRDFINKNINKIDPVLLENFNTAFIINYTHNSTAIEGNTLSLIETKLLLEDNISVGGKKLREVYEVVNHKKAFNYIQECIVDKKVLNEDILKNIHSIVTENIIIGGMYRNSPVRITGASHTPPVGTDMFIQIKNFFADLTFKPQLLNTIELASWVHAEFVRIHPFPDENGRTSRLIMNYILLENGFPPISISLKDKFEYYDVLDKYGSFGDLTDFTNLVYKLVDERLNEIIELIPKREIEHSTKKCKEIEL